jgi:hypothetical protein
MDHHEVISDGLGSEVMLRATRSTELGNRSRYAPYLMVAAICSISIGCATTRGELDVAVSLPQDPGGEPAFRVPEVTDRRVFQARPPNPSIPSLKNPDQIRDKAITSRAIARKRNGYGMAMGDILLPEGHTVSQLASDAIVRAFRLAGFSVVGPGDPAFSFAIPVQAEIDQLWAWVTPGFWAMAIEFESRVRVTTDLGSFRDGEEVRGYIRLRSAAVTSGKWLKTIDLGLEDFVSALRSKLSQEAAAAQKRSAAPPDEDESKRSSTAPADRP